MAPKDLKDKQIGRFEAQVLAEWMRSEKKISLPNGWVAFWRTTPRDVAKRFPVSAEEVVQAARMKEDA